MRRFAYFQDKPVAAAELRWRHHTDERFHHPPFEQAEREDVVRRHRDGGAAPAGERGDRYVGGIAYRHREVLPVVGDIDGSHKFVVAPDLTAGTIGRRGVDGKVRDIECGRAIAGRSRQDGQTDFVVRADVGFAVLKAAERNDGFAVLLGNRRKTGLLQECRGAAEVGEERGDKALIVEVADRQRTRGPVAEDALLQRRRSCSSCF